MTAGSGVLLVTQFPRQTDARFSWRVLFVWSEASGTLRCRRRPVLILKAVAEGDDCKAIAGLFRRATIYLSSNCSLMFGPQPQGAFPD
jgi:hypothetical protein